MYDTRRQEAGRLDCCCCFKTKNMDKRPSAVTGTNLGTKGKWVSQLSGECGCERLAGLCVHMALVESRVHSLNLVLPFRLIVWSVVLRA